MLDKRIPQIQGLIDRDEHTKAWELISDLLNDDPENPQGIYFAGTVMRSQGDIGVALQMFRRALSLRPKIPNIWMHYGACLHDTHQHEQAREAFMVVAKALPTDPMPHANIAASYVQEGKSRESVEAADRALALVAPFIEAAKDVGSKALASRAESIASISKSFACLGLGRWADGWERAQYLYGDTLRIRVYNDPENEEPVWDGSRDKTVVVQADQGLGDMIMFSQCLPQMMADCKQVIVDTNPRLAPLFRRNFPGLVVHDTLYQRENVEWPRQYKIDAHIHISWLGRYYRTKDAEFPRKPYLTSDPERKAVWLKFLEKYPKPWVGLAWKGGIQRTNAKSRTVELEQLRPVLDQGGTFISLAYQDVGLEVARWNIDNATQILCPDLQNDGDFEHTVALIDALDHVITVPTTVVHVAGALGKRAYVLVNDAPAWRYVYRCADGGMIWYPENSVQLYRHTAGEAADAHIVRLAADYGTFVLPRWKAAA